ncbi:MAG: hypothetical protein CM1200mP2_18400 [Planctomycetaceae bacterium]|nr:MAG: hypothetical protein CM1200mP2_18400 [Planctomycetaceae bacterium]
MKNGMLTLTLILAAMPIVRSAQVPAGEVVPTTRKVSFNREVFPILADRCFTCHGPDAKARKANLRLDRADGEDGAYRTHDGSTAVKPGSLEESQLWHRITTDDADEMMPPPGARKKPLSKAERDIIKRWITGGAAYERFWTFVPARKPGAPTVKNRKWSQQPIDLHVLAKLESLGLEPPRRRTGGR